jgi:hypothetical protein
VNRRVHWCRVRRQARLRPHRGGGALPVPASRRERASHAPSARELARPGRR